MRGIILNLVVRVEIAPQTEARLRRQAESAGKNVDAYVWDLVEQAAALAWLDELLTPVRKQLAETGISDEELIADITEAQSDHRADQCKKTA